MSHFGFNYLFFAIEILLALLIYWHARNHNKKGTVLWVIFQLFFPLAFIFYFLFSTSQSSTQIPTSSVANPTVNYIATEQQTNAKKYTFVDARMALVLLVLQFLIAIFQFNLGKSISNDDGLGVLPMLLFIILLSLGLGISGIINVVTMFKQKNRTATYTVIGYLLLVTSILVGAFVVPSSLGEYLR